jgi:hypothetical protein
LELSVEVSFPFLVSGRLGERSWTARRRAIEPADLTYWLPGLPFNLAEQRHPELPFPLSSPRSRLYVF